MTKNDVTWPEVTGSDPEVTSFHQKTPGVAVETLYVKFYVRLSSYRAVTPGGGSNVTGNEVKWPNVTGVTRK